MPAGISTRNSICCPSRRGSRSRNKHPLAERSSVSASLSCPSDRTVTRNCIGYRTAPRVWLQGLVRDEHTTDSIEAVLQMLIPTVPAHGRWCQLPKFTSSSPFVNDLIVGSNDQNGAGRVALCGKQSFLWILPAKLLWSKRLRRIVRCRCTHPRLSLVMIDTHHLPSPQPDQRDQRAEGTPVRPHVKDPNFGLR